MEKILEIKDLDFSYNKHNLLKIPSWSLLRGDKLFIQGASGSGKSTFLNLISGILSPQSGAITFRNSDFSTLPSHKRDEVRGNFMGFIFQQFNLIPFLSGEENILLALEYSQRKKENFKKNSKQLQELAKSLEIENLLKKIPLEMSVGQQQRVAVARALIGEPELIIADEPTSALDTNLRNQFISLLVKEVEKLNSTLVFVSHDPQLKSFFNKTLEISDFKVSS